VASGKAVALIQGEIRNGHRRETAVFRIHIHDCDGVTSFMLEGRLVGPWVKELESCLHRALAAETRGAILVNLAGVSFVDSDGIELLTRMCSRGVRLESTGIMMNSIVEQIERRADKPQSL
jgi:anti-anti-sigma regulatory factor